MKTIINMDNGQAFLATLKVNADGETNVPELPVQYRLKSAIHFVVGTTKLQGTITGFRVYPMYQQHWNPNGFPIDNETWCCVQYTIDGEDGRSYNRYEIDLIPYNPTVITDANQIINWLLLDDDDRRIVADVKTLPFTDTMEIPHEQINGYPLGGFNQTKPQPDNLSAFENFLDTLDIDLEDDDGDESLSDMMDKDSATLKTFKFTLGLDVDGIVKTIECEAEANDETELIKRLRDKYGAHCFIYDLREAGNDE